MINIQPIQISPAATKAKITGFTGTFPIQNDSVILNIGLLDEDGNILKRELCPLTAEEYNSWGEGTEGDTAILALCLQKLNIAIEE